MSNKPTKIPRSLSLETINRIRIPELVSKYFLAGHRIQDIVRRESESLRPAEHRAIQISIQSLLNRIYDYLDEPNQEKAKAILEMQSINASRFSREAGLKRIKRGRANEEDLVYLSKLLANLAVTLEE